MAPRPRATDRFVAQNRRARHDFHILDTLEAGLTLVGSEVKSLRQGLASIQEAFAREVDGEIFPAAGKLPDGFVEGRTTAVHYLKATPEPIVSIMSPSARASCCCTSAR